MKYDLTKVSGVARAIDPEAFIEISEVTDQSLRVCHFPNGKKSVVWVTPEGDMETSIPLPVGTIPIVDAIRKELDRQKMAVTP